MAKERGIYYLYTTGPGIPFSSSTDLIHWKSQGKSFEKPFEWSATAVPGSHDNYWAPHVSLYRGRWLMFFAVSTFGKNSSAIGLASNVVLDPTSKKYAWKDEGIVVQTHIGDNWNAIDPNLTLDKNGDPWLAVGSFWSGIKLIALDPKTLKPKAIEPTIIPIAQRPNTSAIRGAIEAPFLLLRKDWYYLFASFDFCCRGVNSTYNVRIGRSKSIEGPYMDEQGVSMMEGGGTQLLFATYRWKGPGHNCILHDGKSDKIIYHAYDAEENGMPRLQIHSLVWQKDGWPRVSKSN